MSVGTVVRECATPRSKGSICVHVQRLSSVGADVSGMQGSGVWNIMHGKKLWGLGLGVMGEVSYLSW